MTGTRRFRRFRRMKRTEPRPRFRAGWAVRWALLASVLLLVETVGPGDSHGYRFLWEGPSGAADEFYRVGSRFREPPRIWDPEVWGPGKVLSFVLVDSPDWGVPIEEVRRQVEEAMAVWSRIETADVRWRLERIATPDENLGRASRIIPTNPGAGPFPHVRLLGDAEHFNLAPILNYACHVVLAPANVRNPDFLTIAHEFGHCLGLDHPDFLRPGGDVLPEHGERLSFALHQPIMFGGDFAVASMDDRIGASLLWPRAGWLARTGTLWGNVLTEDGSPVSWVSVIAGRVREDGTIVEAVTRFTDDRGEFVIQGLDPGDYVLQAHSLRGRSAIWLNVLSVPLQHLHLRPAIRAAPVSVDAGAVAGPVTLTMRRDENWSEAAGR